MTEKTNKRRYRDLLLRAAYQVLAPLGPTEQDLYTMATDVVRRVDYIKSS